jgi:DUF4097 and DUF4098 domain-containing protein YvlB
MATTEERMRILKMIQEGKITADEGARLLSALRESRKDARPVITTSRSGKGMLRVRVTDMVTGKAKVNVYLPLGLVDAGMSIASQYAPDVNFNQIAEAIRSGTMEGKIVDVVDEEDGEHIEVFID